MAIGLCAIVLLALIGLMSTGLTSSRTASKDTLLPSMAEVVLGDVMGRSDSSLGPYFFTREGVRTDAMEDAVYACEVTVSPVPDALLPEPLRLAGSSQLGLRVRLVFSRPLEPNEPPEIFNTAIARH